jgi:uncharacterized protein YkwD
VRRAALLVLFTLAACEEQPPRSSGSLEAPKVRVAPPIERALLAELNRARNHSRRCGGHYMGRAGALSIDAKLQQAATAYASELLASGNFAHRGSTGELPHQRASRFGVAGFVGEALAENARTATDALGSLLASESHCRLLMSKEATHVGIGFAERADARYRSSLALELGRATR